MDTTTKTKAGGTRRGLAMWLTAAALAVGAGAAGTAALAQPGGPGGHHATMHGGGGMPFPMMGRGLDRMLDEVQATDAQRTQIRQIADAAAADLKTQHESARSLRQRAAELFTSPVVDANAAEVLRQQMLQQHDAASKRMLQAMLDVSRVLTPEQRTQLAARMKERSERMREHMERRSGGGSPAPR